jgi:hypothetical protein
LDEAAARKWADENLGSAEKVQLGLAGVKDKVDAIPDKKNIAFSEAGSEVLAQRLVNLRNLMSSIPNVKRITLESYTVGNRTVSIPGQATGGPVIGPGPKGKDSELRMLAPGEHVITAEEVDAAGGHAAVEDWRRALRSPASIESFKTPYSDGMFFEFATVDEEPAELELQEVGI